LESIAQYKAGKITAKTMEELEVMGKTDAQTPKFYLIRGFLANFCDI
jgi:hypothetical protein